MGFSAEVHLAMKLTSTASGLCSTMGATTVGPLDQHVLLESEAHIVKETIFCGRLSDLLLGFSYLAKATPARLYAAIHCRGRLAKGVVHGRFHIWGR